MDKELFCYRGTVLHSKQNWGMFQLKNGIKISVGQAVLDRNNILYFLINNWRIACYWNFNAIFEFLRQFASELIFKPVLIILR